jgi:hypothetical protein
LFTPAGSLPDVMGSTVGAGPLPATMLGIAPVVEAHAGTLALVVEEGLPQGAVLKGKLVTVYGAI